MTGFIFASNFFQLSYNWAICEFLEFFFGSSQTPGFSCLTCLTASQKDMPKSEVLIIVLPLYSIPQRGLFTKHGCHRLWCCFSGHHLKGWSTHRTWKVIGWFKCNVLWKRVICLVVEPTHLKNICQNGNLFQIGVKIKNVWNHPLPLVIFKFCKWIFRGRSIFLAMVTEVICSWRLLKWAPIVFHKFPETGIAPLIWRIEVYRQSANLLVYTLYYIRHGGNLWGHYMWNVKKPFCLFAIVLNPGGMPAKLHTHRSFELLKLCGFSSPSEKKNNANSRSK